MKGREPSIKSNQIHVYLDCEHNFNEKLVIEESKVSPLEIQEEFTKIIQSDPRLKKAYRDNPYFYIAVLGLGMEEGDLKQNMLNTLCDLAELVEVIHRKSPNTEKLIERPNRTTRD